MYLHIVPSLLPSGDTAQIRILAQATCQAGEETHIFTFHPVPMEVQKEFEGCARIHELRAHFSLEPYWLLRRAVGKLRLQPKAVHVWETELLIPGLRLARYLKVPATATFRHSNVYREHFPVLRRFTRLAANSSALRDAAIRAGNQGNWHVVHDVLPAASPIRSSVSRLEFLAELGLPSDTVLTASVGPISYWKRWQWAVWSIDSVVRVHPEMCLLFFDPDLENIQNFRLDPRKTRERASIMEFMRQYEREEVVRFLPFRNDFSAILPYIDFFWNTQTCPGSGLAVLEAMAAGVPVISHRLALDEDLFPTGTFTSLPTEPETFSLASATHSLWIHEEQKKEQIHLAKESVERAREVDSKLDFYLM